MVREGNKKVSAVQSTRHQAEEHGRSLARQSRADFVLHDRDGRVLVHDFYGEPHGGEVEGAHGEQKGQVTVTRSDTGAVQRQVAYHDRARDTWTVEVHTYPAIDQSNPGLRRPDGTRACRVRRVRRAESGRHAESLPGALGEGQYLI